jgi:hypothetical protein
VLEPYVKRQRIQLGLVDQDLDEEDDFDLKEPENSDDED